jgi:hypothetical protein
MTPARLIAIGFIYVCSAVAWGVLGGSLMARTGESDSRLTREVALLWGGKHVQVAPDAVVERPVTVTEQIAEPGANGGTVTRQVSKQTVERAAIPLDSSRVEVSLDLDQRQKGLLWYDTYSVRFRGTWRVHNPDAVPRRLVVRFMFPSADAIYDGFVFTAGNARSAAVTDLSQGVDAAVDVPPGADVPIGIAYTSRGLGDWAYAFAREGVSPVREFSLVMKTDFDDVDFPAGTMSPTSKARDGAGWSLTWKFASLVTGQRIGMDLPDRMNPGPLAARITWFAPVSLLFFLAVMVILGVLRGHSLHPMNYAFVSAAFFAFHLLLAYLVDHLDIHLSFAIAAVTSVALVVSYLRLVAGTRFALREAGLAQLVFLVLFSYAFFFEGYTGLTVTVGAIVTLFALMQMTARVDWGAVFARRTAR